MKELMFNILKRHKIVTIAVIADLVLYWILFYSGIVLPFINPSAEAYKSMLAKGTSFPRNTNQMLIWFFMHFPASYIFSGMARDDIFLSLSVIQTGIIAYFIEKLIHLIYNLGGRK